VKYITSKGVTNKENNKMKFNRVNLMQLSKELNVSYLCVDLLRQTTIERIVKNTPNNTKKQVIDAIINNIKYL
jgi:hypothetical protein